MSVKCDNYRLFRDVNSIPFGRSTMFGTIVTDRFDTTVDNYDTAIGEEKLAETPIRSYADLTKAYIYLNSIVQRTVVCVSLKFFTLIAAGPVGNIRATIPPLPGSEHRLASLLYFI